MALLACELVTKGCGNDLLCIRKLCGGKAHFAILVLTRWCILYCDDQLKPLSFQIDGQRLSEQKLNVNQLLISQHFPICTHTVARPVAPSAPQHLSPSQRSLVECLHGRSLDIYLKSCKYMVAVHNENK